MQQIGSGTTTLTGSNTHSGGTFFNNGTLAAAADSNLGTGGLTFNGGTFQYNLGFTLVATRLITINAPGGTINTQSFNPTIQQGMTGAGALTKTGSGTLILTGANTYGGGTTISVGTLQLGNGGTTGSILGNVLDNGVLAFNRSDPVTFPGIISGSGSLQQNGSGTTILTADNTYAGGTTISLGTLQVGNGGATGSVGSGPILDNGALIFNRSGTVEVPGAIIGTGSLTQSGVAGARWF